jgi:hypothetical protein
VGDDDQLRRVQDILGDALTAALLGVPVQLLQAQHEARPLAAETDARLTALLPLINDLGGGYNDDGIRRWWHRPRVALDGRSPRQVWVECGGDPASQNMARLRALTASLRGSGGVT